MLEHLKRHLALLEQQDMITIWSDTNLHAGMEWEEELRRHLKSANIFLLLISSHFMASNYCYSTEMGTAIKRHELGEARVIPIILRPINWQDSPLGKLQALPRDGKPIKSANWFTQDDAFEDVEKGLRQVVVIERSLKEGNTHAADLHFREDAALLRRQRAIFERSAFNTACIWELFLSQLIEAIDDTLGAINTGSLYSRKGNLMASFPDKNQYILQDFKDTFSRISHRLGELKRKVIEFEGFFKQVNPRYSHHQNFYAMLMDSIEQVSDEELKTIVDLMDEIDCGRNEILADLNILLSRCGDTLFNEIELSSQILRNGHIGGAARVASLLRNS